MNSLESRFLISSLLAVLLIILALGLFRLVQFFEPTEIFLSSHEGKILSGVILRLETRSSEVRNECDLVFNNEFETSECNVDFCDYLDSLDRHFKVSVIYHIVSNERPVVGLAMLKSSSLIDSISELELLNNAFLVLNDSLKNNFVGFPDFTDAKNFQRLLFDDAYLKSFAQNDNKHLLQLRKIGFDWRTAYKDVVRRIKLRSVGEQCRSIGTEPHPVSVVVGFHDEYCSDRTDYCNCIIQASDDLSGRKWAQDVLFAQKENDNHFLRAAYKADPIVAESFNVIANNIAIQAGVRSKTVSKLEFHGGNMLTNSKLILIGRDVLTKYLDPTKPNYRADLNEIGLNVEEDEVNEVTISEAIEAITDRKLLWVGTNEMGRRYNASPATLDYGNQPIYHIDLFMTLLKWGVQDATSTVDTLYYALAVPEEDNIIWLHQDYHEETTAEQRTAIRAQMADLKDWVNQTADKLDTDLAERKIVAKRITIPLPISFREFYELIDSYWSFCNGLAENYKDSTIYYMPQYGSCSDDYIAPYFESAKDILSDYVTVKPIVGPYASKDGLHCSFLVTQRQD